MLFNDSENVPAQEDALPFRDSIPPGRIEIINAVGESETKAGRASTLTMLIAGVANRRGKAAQAACLFWLG